MRGARPIADGSLLACRGRGVLAKLPANSGVTPGRPARQGADNRPSGCDLLVLINGSSIVPIASMTLGINPSGALEQGVDHKKYPVNGYKKPDHDQRLRFRPFLRRHPLESR